MAELTVAEVARLVGGRVEGDGARTIRAVAPLSEAGPDSLSFVANRRYLRYVDATCAGALLVPEELGLALPDRLACIRVADPHAALATLLPVLYPAPAPVPGVHPTAVLEEGVEIAPDAVVGPYAVVGSAVRIEAGAVVGPHCVVGDGSVVGEGTVLHPQVTLYPGVRLGRRCIVHSGARIGADGFGYAFVDGEHRKVPQVGGVEIEDDVEIGANATIDRGSIGDTRVGGGTKIDNLVHLGHNAQVGPKVIIVAQVGVSGSSEIGGGAVLGGQAGIAGHLTIGAGARVGAQAGVIGDIPAGETVSGYPARPHREAMKAQAGLFRLPQVLRRLRRIEKALFGRSGE